MNVVQKDVIYVTGQDYIAFTTPHHLKMKSICCGVPVVMVPLTVFSDDTSGNKSKLWNKFDSYCVRLGGLPVAMNSQIHIICTSNIGTSDGDDCSIG